jgi:hypothetical protein
MYRLLDLSRARTSRLLPWGLIAACLLSGSGIWSPTVRSLAQESEQESSQENSDSSAEATTADTTPPASDPASAPVGPSEAISSDPQMVRWQFYQEFTSSEASNPSADQGNSAPETPSSPPSAKSRSKWISILLDRSVFSRARFDLADLRLVDSQGGEVPFVLRVRREEKRDEAFEAERFNESVVGESTREISLDLGESPAEHDQLDVDTEGNEFRRLATLEGSDDGQTWRTLVQQPLTRIAAPESNQVQFDHRRLKYPLSRQRYLRLRVDADSLVDQGQPPKILSATAHRTVEIPGEQVEWPLQVGYRDATRTQGAAASAWVLELGGDQTPVDKIRLAFAESDTDYARDYILEAAGPYSTDTGYRHLTAGIVRRTPGQAAAPFIVEFSSEVVSSRLRLSVVDYQNPPLNLETATVVSAARELIFAHDSQHPGPWRLFYGNPRAEAPHYDLERNLPTTLAPPPQRLELGPQIHNPNYAPPPPPLSERAPWLIYVVLSAACGVVALIVLDVARKAIREHDQSTARAA